MNTAQTTSPAQQRQQAARAEARAGCSQKDSHEDSDDDTGFNGWLASSLELKFGLLVQYLRIDPLDADWRDVFAPA